ncbi:MAG: hypothetical protein KatS3mg003_0895 [Candidatus Nitrosocaldaceae archaeon]|nr:MAG: hypothetical protein KatS3mg003_0895 [Candidatus Nitrosocaldaceae archaeon]
MKKAKYMVIGVIVLSIITALPIQNVKADHGNAIVADPGVVAIGGSTDLSIHTDPAVTLVAISSWTVTEGGDGGSEDICALDHDGDNIPSVPTGPFGTGAVVTYTYPDDFVVITDDTADGIGDGCDTGASGQYITEATVTTSIGAFNFTDDWEVSFLVLPESPIGALAVIGSSIAALGAFFALKRRSIA